MEADVAAYGSASGRSEISEEAFAALIDVASSIEDLIGCYPGAAEIEAERLAQRIQATDIPLLMKLMSELREKAERSPVVGASAIAALKAEQDAVDDLTAIIDAVHPAYHEVSQAILSRSLEKSSEAAVKVGVAALVSNLAGIVVGIGVLVMSFAPLGRKADEISKSEQDSNASA
jgi:hypothetical protein